MTDYAIETQRCEIMLDAAESHRKAAKIELDVTQARLIDIINNNDSKKYIEEVKRAVEILEECHKKLIEALFAVNRKEVSLSQAKRMQGLEKQKLEEDS